MSRHRTADGRPRRPRMNIGPRGRDALDSLVRRGPMTAYELAAELGVRRGTLWDALARLVRHELVSEDHDGSHHRRVTYAVTDLGRRALAARRRVGLEPGVSAGHRYRLEVP